MRDQVRSAFVFTVAAGRIAGIDLVMDEELLGALDIEIGAPPPPPLTFNQSHSWGYVSSSRQEEP